MSGPARLTFARAASGRSRTPRRRSASRSACRLLLTGQPGLPASSAVAAGIRSKLVSVWSTRVAIETEHVDVARFTGTDYEHHLRAGGLGMGLAISRSIVQAHEGRIGAENDPAGGAIFRVRRPTERSAIRTV